jgi:aminopeptidase N
VDPKEWLDITRKGLAYFNGEFGYPYPYAKYDQVIVPDFNAGAMENAAAVTFSERMVHRTKPTTDERRDVAGTILHEMSHMWFGDLVTMHWWNGLWLNESFATYMSSKAMAEATDFKGAWEYFHGNKSWAQLEDQMITTHPIEVPIPDTDSATTSFDGITYGKGAAAIQQLSYYLSPEDFREGLQRYFQRFALHNTTIHDFMKMLAEASGKDLSKWQKTWLQTAGLNGLRADWACDKGKISKLSLLQAPPALPEGSKELRPHRTQVSFYDIKAGKPKIRAKETIAVTYAAADTPVPQAVGKACPAFVFPNEDDYDYAKLELDPVSLKVAREQISHFEDPLLRRMLWDTLWQMTRDTKIRAQDYIDTLLKEAGGEKDSLILTENLRRLGGTRGMRGSALKYLGSAQRDEVQPKLDAWLIQHLKSAPTADLRRVWFDAFVGTAAGQPALDFARGLLTGKHKVEGMPIQQEERWKLITMLAVNGATDAQTLITAEVKKDPSDMGQKAQVAAEASITDPESKKKWLAQLMTALHADTQDAMPVAKLREAAGSYYSLRHEDQIAATADAYFEALPLLDKIADSPYASTFAWSLYPTTCDPKIVERTTAMLASHPDLPAVAIKALKVSRQEEERCIAARAKAGDAAPQASPSPSPSPTTTPSPSPSSAPK